MAIITEILKAGTTSWTPPSGVSSVDVVACQGPGGNGSRGRSTNSKPSGGSGGFSTKASISVTAGVPVTCQISAGGSEASTWFDSTGTVLANGGGNASGATAGAAGAAGVGDLTRAGTAGRTGFSGDGGTGGAGAPGPDGVGAQGGNGGGSVSPGQGGGGANGGSAGSNAASALIGGAGGNNRTGSGGGAGGNASTLPGTGSGGGGSGGAGSNSNGVTASYEAIWTDDSGNVNNGTTIGPGGGGGGGRGNSDIPQAGNGGYGGGGGGQRGSGTFGANGGDGYIVLQYDTGGGGGPVVLTIDNAAHGHSAGNVTVADANIAAANAAHAHSADNLILAGIDISVASASHAHLAYGLILLGIDVNADNSQHAHSTDNTSISFTPALIAASASHTHAATEPSMAAGASLAVDNALHAHVASIGTVIPLFNITSDSALHSHASTSPAMAAGANLSVAVSLHAHASTSPTLVPNVDVSVISTAHTHAAGNANLSYIPAGIDLAPTDTAHSTHSTMAALGYGAVLEPFIAATATDTNVTASVFVPTLPSYAVGDRVIIFAGRTSGTTISSVSAGWTREDASGTHHLFTRIMTGGADDTLTITLSASSATNTARSYAIRNHDPSEAIDGTSLSQAGTGANIADPQAVSASDASMLDRPYLMLVSARVSNGTGFTAPPSTPSPGFDTGASFLGSGSIHATSAMPYVFPASFNNFNPGVFTHGSTTVGWSAFTIGVAGYEFNIEIGHTVHEHVATSPSLTLFTAAIAANTLHAHAATSPSLATKNIITPANTLHTHSATEPAVVLPVNNAIHAHVTTAPVMTQKSTLTANAAAHAHSTTQPSLLPNVDVAPANTAHSHSTTAPTLVPNVDVAVSSATHTHVTTSPTFFFNVDLNAQNTLHAHLAGNVNFVRPIVPTAATHDHIVSQPLLTPSVANPDLDDYTIVLQSFAWTRFRVAEVFTPTLY